MPDKTVSVGLVTWNSAHCLAPCLNALQAQTQQNWDLMVVDNASTDRSLAVVAEYFPQAAVHRNAVNEGFARAHNYAIRETRAHYYLALNPDIALAPDYMARLVEALNGRADCGLAGGKLLLAPGRLDGSGLVINRRRQQVLRGHGESDHAQFDQPGEVFGIDGAAPLYRRAMLEDICVQGEYFDEAFFSYKEDVDLAWRARLFGWRAWYEPAAVALHERTFRPGRRERASTAVRRYSVRNRYLMLLKNETRAGWSRDWPAIVFYDLQILVYLLLCEPRSLVALKDVWRLWRGALQKRAHIQQRRRVTEEQTLDWFK